MISWIHPNIAINDAGKKGTGLFATDQIKKDEIVVVIGGKILEQSHIMNSAYRDFDDYCIQVEQNLLICPIEPRWEKMDGAFLMNHSCNPSCGFRNQITLIALRDIEADEEITYDYAMTDATLRDIIDITDMECLCNTQGCRKTITGKDWQRTDLQEKYRGCFSPFLQKMIDIGE